MRSASSSELAGSGPEEGTLTRLVGMKRKKVWPSCRQGMMLGSALGSSARERACGGVHGGRGRAGRGTGGGRQVWALRIQVRFFASCTTLL